MSLPKSWACYKTVLQTLTLGRKCSLLWYMLVFSLSTGGSHAYLWDSILARTNNRVAYSGLYMKKMYSTSTLNPFFRKGPFLCITPLPSTSNDVLFDPMEDSYYNYLLKELTPGSLGPTCVSARLVGLTVRHAFSSSFPFISLPLYTSVTFSRGIAVLIPKYFCRVPSTGFFQVLRVLYVFTRVALCYSLRYGIFQGFGPECKGYSPQPTQGELGWFRVQ